MSEIKKMKQISYDELLIEVHEVYTLLYKLVNSDIKITSCISTSLIPYLSFVCDSLDYFHEGTNKIHSSWYEEIKGTSIQQLIKKNRITLKLYSDHKKNKVIPILEDDISLFSDYLIRDYNIIQKLFIKSFGQYDLGIYSFKNIDYANTYQLFKNSKAIYVINNELDGSTIQEFAKVLANYISQSNIYPVSKMSNKIFSLSRDFSHQDFYFRDLKRFNAFNDKEDKYWRLFLYNYYCQNNFIRIMFPIVLGVRKNFYYRMKFCTYLLSIKGLDLLLKKVPKIQDKYPRMNQLIEARENIVSAKSTLRNNLFHYEIVDIPYESFNVEENIFRQMVEYSVGISFEEFENQIDNELDEYQKLVEEILF